MFWVITVLCLNGINDPTCEYPWLQPVFGTLAECSAAVAGYKQELPAIDTHGRRILDYKCGDWSYLVYLRAEKQKIPAPH